MNSSSSSTAAPSSERLHLWDDCLRIFRDNLSPEQYKAWFEPISCVSCSDSELILRIPSPFFMEQLEAQYYNLLGRTLYKVYGPGIQLRYEFYQVSNDPSTAVRMTDSHPPLPPVREQHPIPLSPLRKTTLIRSSIPATLLKTIAAARATAWRAP